MASLNSAGAQDPNKTKTKSSIVTEREYLSLSHPFDTYSSGPAKVLHDFLRGEKDKSVKSETPKILEALINTITSVEEEVNVDKFNEIINEILPFDSKINELHDKKIQKIWDEVKAVREKERLKLLAKKRMDALSRVEKSFKAVCEKYSEIQIEIEEFKCKDLPTAVSEMRSFVDRGFLSRLNLLKYHDTIEQCIDLSNQRIDTLQKIDKFRYSVDYIIKLTNSKTPPIDEPEIPESDILIVRHKKNIISVEKVNLKEESKGSKKNTKKSICRLEHNTPLCKNCSWQTSWLKNFKKKGVYIKVIDTTDSNQTWYNNINTE